MARNYRLRRAEPGTDWDEFVRSSENGTLFSTSAYLARVPAPSALYWCLNGEERRAAVALMESAGGDAAVLHDLVIYNGLMFGPPTNRQNQAQRLSERFEISAFVAQALAERYQAVALSLHPTVADLRPFLWHNWGGEGAKYVPDLRYTSHLQIADFATAQSPEEIDAYREASTSRRQEIRYAAAEGVTTGESFEPEAFIAFYEKTMNRQGIEVPVADLAAMRSVIAGLEAAGLGRMFVARNAAGEPGSMAFFGLDEKRAYYLFGANDPDKRAARTGTAVLWDAFRALALDGVHEVDLEGVNSPRRGWFKLSFGGDLRPYYHLFLPAATQ